MGFIRMLASRDGHSKVIRRSCRWPALHWTHVREVQRGASLQIEGLLPRAAGRGADTWQRVHHDDPRNQLASSSSQSSRGKDGVASRMQNCPSRSKANDMGVRGGIEYGFSSTTTEKSQAIHYAGMLTAMRATRRPSSSFRWGWSTAEYATGCPAPARARGAAPAAHRHRGARHLRERRHARHSRPAVAQHGSAHWNKCSREGARC